jgi:hypothetical protein
VSLFIRDDIRVRDLDRKYKKRMRLEAKRAACLYRGQPSWNMAVNIPIWDLAAQFEKVTLKGA